MSSPFRITDITPAPTPEELAVIVAALDAGWPRPVAAEPDWTPPDTTWRFSQRRWHARAVPMRTWGTVGSGTHH